MTTNDQIWDAKPQYDINRKSTETSSDKINKYEYLTGKEILPSNQQQIIIKFTNSPWRRTFEKQTETIEDQGKNKLRR